MWHHDPSLHHERARWRRWVTWPASHSRWRRRSIARRAGRALTSRWSRSVVPPTSPTSSTCRFGRSAHGRLSDERSPSCGPTSCTSHWARYAPFLSTSGVPLVVHAHGSDLHRRQPRIPRAIVRRSLERAAAVVVATPDLLELVPRGASYVPNIVDLHKFTPTERDDSDRRTVLLFARLLSVKGADDLIETGRIIRLTDPSTRVVAFGGTPCRRIRGPQPASNCSLPSIDRTSPR